MVSIGIRFKNYIAADKEMAEIWIAVFFTNLFDITGIDRLLRTVYSSNEEEWLSGFEKDEGNFNKPEIIGGENN